MSSGSSSNVLQILSDDGQDIVKRAMEKILEKKDRAAHVLEVYQKTLKEIEDLEEAVEDLKHTLGLDSLDSLTKKE